MTKYRTIEVQGIEFATADEAIQHANADGAMAIRIGGKNLAVLEAEALRLAAARIPFAYLTDRAGLIMTVPVND
jgi:hypothetical protein